jgi:hypothetical protein
MKFQDLARAGLSINCESYCGFLRTDVPIVTGGSVPLAKRDLTEEMMVLDFQGGSQ